MLPLEAQYQLNCVLQVTADLAGQHSSVLCRLKTDSPAGQSGAALGNGPLEETWGKKKEQGGLRYRKESDK